MPPRRNNQRNSLPAFPRRGSTKLGPPPQVMTMEKAMYVLALCIIFDALSGFFALFWFFGPVFAGLACPIIAGHVTGGVLGGPITAGACGVAAGAAGAFFNPALVSFGAIMAMMVGFVAWGTIGLILVMTNRRIFREDLGQILWFLGGLLIDQVPIVNAIPALTPTIWRLYRAQIKKDKTALAAYERQKAELEAQERFAQVEEYRRLLALAAEQARRERGFSLQG